MNIINRLRNGAREENDFKKSYSQSGEDLLIDYILSWMDISKPRYLDLGAHHPTYLSNTYYFYTKGCSGVCVEPDPMLMDVIEKQRPNDICLRAGVGEINGEADFYIMTERTLNTFSKDEAEMYKIHYKNMKIEKIIRTPIKNINDMIKENFSTAPNFLSIDIEGLDFEILKTLNFKKYRPEVICAETIIYTGPKKLKKNSDLLKLMKDSGYFVYGETLINTIFVDKNAWSKSKMPKIEGVT